MVNVLVDGKVVEMDIPLPAQINDRIIPAADFLALWTPAEVQMCAADPVLNYAMLGAITQGTVNLDSARLPQLLALAMDKGLTQARAAQIAAGTPPTP